MDIKKYNSAKEIGASWDACIDSVYQKLEFLIHLEKHNPCNQRYYVGFDRENLIAGAVVYSLKINVLTFSKRSLSIPFTVIGIPASVDAAGAMGKDRNQVKELILSILKQEKGAILCLNYNEIDDIEKIIKMQTMPTLIFEKKNNSWNEYLNSLRHNYRRRILQAERKLGEVEKRIEPCSCFTQEYYNQYLKVMMRTKEKLETLSFNFFCHLPNDYKLISLYHKEVLLAWHISISDASTYYFLFGGINYSLRDKYDIYCNNVIQIIREGFDHPVRYINLGQNALITKNRLGGKVVPLRMFVYHANPLIRWLFFLMQGAITYKTKEKEVNIYKSKK